MAKLSLEGQGVGDVRHVQWSGYLGPSSHSLLFTLQLATKHHGERANHKGQLKQCCSLELWIEKWNDRYHLRCPHLKRVLEFRSVYVWERVRD